MNKLCVRCGVEKPLDLFAKGKNYKDGRRGTCKQCHTSYMTEYYNSNPDKKAAKIKLNTGKDTNWKRHKLTEKTFQEMVDKYDGKCYACNINKATNIDHDHSCCSGSRSCGKCVRGVLCNQCNTALGLVKDSKETLNNLINYLK
jgi:hypothetical protein